MMKRLSVLILSCSVLICLAQVRTDATPLSQAEGPVLSGRVVDTDGSPVVNAVVTDGYVHSVTDEKGYYRFESPYPHRVRYVSVRTPADYRPVVREGRTIFYTPVTAYNGKERTADITLEKRNNKSDAFTMLMIADPQARPYSPDAPGENRAYATVDVWKDLFDDLKNKTSEISGECYGMCLGDIAASTTGKSVYTQYCQGLASLGIPFFQVIGNHDHFHANPVPETDDECAAAFEAVFGPRNYSFDLGKFHFVVLDNCIYRKGLRRYPFMYGLEDEFLEWLKGDLAHVSEDMSVMLCAHADFFKESGELYDSLMLGGMECCYKYKEFLNLLESCNFEKIYVWAGHTHNTNFIGKVDSPADIEAFVVGRCTGGLGNDYIAGDGTPRGFLVLEASGTEISWTYHTLAVENAPFRGEVFPEYVWKPADLSEPRQMSVYPRGSYGDDYVYANVWLWDKHWEIPVLKINDKEYTMTRDYVYDLGYKEIVKHFKKQGTKYSYKGSSNKHGFYVKVPDDVSGVGTVSVTDRWGRTWTSDVSLEPVPCEVGMKYMVFDCHSMQNSIPQSPATDIRFTRSGYDFNLSCGFYRTGSTKEENYICMSGKGSTLTIPAIPGYKLVRITVRPAGNMKNSQSARVVDMTGNAVQGGWRLTFYGNTTDSWELEEAVAGASYKLMSYSDMFNIGELRLTYIKVDNK